MWEQVPVGSKLVIEVELVNGLMFGEFRCPDPQGRAGGSTFGDFAREDCGESGASRATPVDHLSAGARIEPWTYVELPPATSIGRNVCLARVVIWGDGPDMHPQESTWNVPRKVGGQA